VSTAVRRPLWPWSASTGENDAAPAWRDGSQPAESVRFVLGNPPPHGAEPGGLTAAGLADLNSDPPPGGLVAAVLVGCRPARLGLVQAGRTVAAVP
jgi:hypothetical protein